MSAIKNPPIEKSTHYRRNSEWIEFNIFKVKRRVIHMANNRLKESEYMLPPNSNKTIPEQEFYTEEEIANILKAIDSILKIGL